VKKSQLPDQKKTTSGNLAGSQNLTVPNLQYVLKGMGIGVRHNMMTNTIEYSGVAQDALTQDATRLTVQDMLLGLDINNLGRYDEIVGALGRRSPYHPMEEWMRGLPPASGDPIGDLIASVKTDNPLWPVYLENWLIQVVEAVCGWRGKEKASIPHVLVLAGAQGAGKSFWLKRLGGQWFKGEAELHLSTSSGKDHQLEALKYPMVELSELDGIFRKADIAHMKSFISREIDSIRSPYERKATIRPRMTSFCASVNEAEFLNDPSGSRRFWPVSVNDIDWGYQVDLEGIWSEAYRLWCADPNFNLTADEDAQRASMALDVHTMMSEMEETITEYYRRHVGSERFKEAAMNRTEILKMLFGGRAFSNKDISLAGKILTDIRGNHKTLDGKQRAWMFPYNEFAIDRATWPDISHMKIVK